MGMMSVMCGSRCRLADKDPEVKDGEANCFLSPAPLSYLSPLTAMFPATLCTLFSGHQKIIKIFLYTPSVQRSTLPHSVPPESCCLSSACCSSAEAPLLPLQMALAPRGTPALVEERGLAETDNEGTERGKKQIRK